MYDHANKLTSYGNESDVQTKGSALDNVRTAIMNDLLANRSSQLATKTSTVLHQ
jgi:hypothetical protein